ncbi:unnamed protein product [Lota lota]
MSVYPAYVRPQAPGYPVDYRRVFNSCISSPVATDVHSRYPHKMTRSVVQRNPSDPLSKLVDRLDGLSTKEKGEGDREEKYLPKAPPSGRVTPQRRSTKTQHTGAPPVDNGTCVHQGPWPVTNDPQDVNHQEESTLSELSQVSWTLKAGPRQAAVSGVEEFWPLDSSSVNEEDEKTLCLVTTRMLQQDQPLWLFDPNTKGAQLPPHLSLESTSMTYNGYTHQSVQVDTGRQSVLSLSIDEQSSGEDVGSADISASVWNLNTSDTVTTGGGKMAIERNAVVRSSMEDSGKEICVPLMATQFESSEADQDVCACCGTSLEENDYSTGDPGEHFHGSPFEVPRARMAHNFVEDFAANERPSTSSSHEKGNGGYDRAPPYCPPTCLRSKAKDYKRRKQRGGAQPRNYDAKHNLKLEKGPLEKSEKHAASPLAGP